MDILKTYPSLGYELSCDDIQNSNSVYHSGGTSHQKKAAKIAAVRLGWESTYVEEVCIPDRPPLTKSLDDSRNQHLNLSWEERCQEWESQHSYSVEALAILYETEFKRIGLRLLEPVTRSDQRLLLSAHDRNPRNAGRKPIGDKPRGKTLITLDTGLKTKAQALAKAGGLSLSQLINDLLAEYLA